MSKFILCSRNLLQEVDSSLVCLNKISLILDHRNLIQPTIFIRKENFCFKITFRHVLIQNCELINSIDIDWNRFIPKFYFTVNKFVFTLYLTNELPISIPFTSCIALIIMSFSSSEFIWSNCSTGIDLIQNFTINLETEFDFTHFIYEHI